MALKQMVLCDGSIAKWEPVLVQNTCDECGQPHPDSFTDTAEPDFHGRTKKVDGKYYCSRCGEQFVGLAECNEILIEKTIPAIIEQFNRTNPLLEMLKKRA